jgi:hypothetical protein
MLHVLFCRTFFMVYHEAITALVIKYKDKIQHLRSEEGGAQLMRQATIYIQLQQVTPNISCACKKHDVCYTACCRASEAI